MNPAPISCTKCNTPVPELFYNQGAPSPCPGCNALLHIEVFPAFGKPIAEGKSGEFILVEGEAGCFYHPQKRAVIPCAACGRFLCALCDLELNDEHLCPICLHTGRKRGNLVQLETRRVLYDSSALWLSVLPVLLVITSVFSLLTAPIAVVLAIYSWYQPASILPRTRIRSYLAIFFGLLQIFAWVLLFTGAWKFPGAH